MGKTNKKYLYPLRLCKAGNRVGRKRFNFDKTGKLFRAYELVLIILFIMFYYVLIIIRVSGNTYVSKSARRIRKVLTLRGQYSLSSSSYKR